MSTEEYYNSSIEECMLMMKGYEDRNNDQRRIIRSLEYVVYCALTEPAKRVNIFAYQPIAGDPTPAEIKAAEKEQRKSKVDYYKNRITQLKQTRKKTSG